jgi:transcriptional regulator with PAS, ATPase and Fis domain
MKEINEKILNVVERIKSSISLSQQHQDYYNQLPVMVFVKDKQDNIIYMNDYGLKMLNKKPEDIYMKSYKKVAHSEFDTKITFDNDTKIFETGKTISRMMPQYNNPDILWHIIKSPFIEERTNEITGIIGLGIHIPSQCPNCELVYANRK